jgi:hypothetical protein
MDVRRGRGARLPISASLSSALDTIIVASALDILPVAALKCNYQTKAVVMRGKLGDLGHALLELGVQALGHGGLPRQAR